MDSVNGKRLDHALIIGSGMAGLLAARALAPHATKVSVLERDTIPDVTSQARKGVPQGNHAHLLLRSGLTNLESLFPGISCELEQIAGPSFDGVRETLWKIDGAFRPRFDSDHRLYALGRPALETVVRRRVTALPNVVTLNANATGLLVEREMIRGVLLAGGGTLTADLVVDASGRGTRVPAWLERSGFGRPEVWSGDLGLSYTSCVVRPRVTSRHDFRMLLIPPVMPRCPRGGLWVPLEQGRYLATLITYEKDRPPLDWKGFRAWAVGVDDPLLARVLDDCEPLSEPQRFAISKRVFRRYDRFAGRPKRLIALGDAMCSFDPAFGQGMSVCALEARALERLLADRELSVDELVARYFTQAAALIATPWSMSRAHPAPLQTRRRCGPREAILARLPARVFESSGSVADAAPRLRARRESRGASEQPACTRPRASSAAPSRPARVAAKCSGARRRL